MKDVAAPEDTPRKTWLHEFMAVLGLAVAVLLVHRHLLLLRGGHPVFFVRWDLWQFMWPKLSYLTDALRAGHWPFWNPYDFAGEPLFLNLQTLYYHPLVAAYAWLIGFSLRGLQVYVVLLYLFGALNMYVLARQFTSHRFVCAALGLLFSISGFSLGNAQHFPQLHVFLTEPLALALLIRFVRTGTRRNLALAVLGMCLLIAGGYPSILGYLILFNLGYGLAEWSAAGRDRRRLLGLALVPALAGIVMAPMLIPAFLSLPYISRGAGVSYEVFTSHSLPVPYLATCVNPMLGSVYLEGTAIDPCLRNCAWGVPVAALAAMACFDWKRRRFLLVVLLLSLLGCLGRATPAARLFYVVPLLSNSRHVTFEFRALLIVAVFVLAAGAVDRALDPRFRRRWLIAVAAAAGLHLVATAGLLPRMNLAVTEESLQVFLGWTLSGCVLMAMLVVLPLLLYAGYASTAFSSRLRPVVWVSLVLLEALVAGAANYGTAAVPLPPENWAGCEQDEARREKGFPPPAPFSRIRVYPRLEHSGCIFKRHTDWGFDSTVLQQLVDLHRSDQSGALNGPFIRVPTLPYRFSDYGPNSFTIEFEEPVTAHHVEFVMMHYPGWRAVSEGQERECHPTDLGFIGVATQPGDRVLTLAFRPRGYRVLLALSAVALLFLGGLVLYERLRGARMALPDPDAMR